MSQKKFTKCNIYQQELLHESAHSGQGEINFKRLLTKSDIDGACNFMDYAVLPPKTTVGRHTHKHDQEEYYFILKGQGRMEVEGESFDVNPGDLVRNPPGGTHSLLNTGKDDIHMFVFELQILV